VGASAAQIGLSYLEQGVPALVPYLKAAFHLSVFTAGFFGVSVNLGRAAIEIVASRPVDRFGERRVILVAGAGAGVLAILAAQGHFAVVTLGLLALTGIAQGLTTVASIMGISRWFLRGRRGIPMGIRQASVPLGGALAAASLPALALAYGWRWALTGAGALTICASLAGMLIYRDYAGVQRRSTSPPRLTTAIPLVLQTRNMVQALLVAMVLSSSQYVVLTYLQLFMIGSAHASLRFAAIALTIAQVAGIGGRLLWGTISHLLFHGRMQGILIVMLALAAAGSLGLSFTRPATAVWLGLPMSALLGLTTVGASGMYVALISDVAPREYDGVAIGLMLTLVHLAAIVVPPLFGALVVVTGSYRLPWTALGVVQLLALPVVASMSGATSQDLQRTGLTDAPPSNPMVRETTTKSEDRR
jgi:sugar phosphate permease